jgi:carbon storage regulator CsrA
MLVLTRRLGEEIIIDGDIRVTVVATSPGKVRLGITAPAHVAIDRLEIHQRKEQFEDRAGPAKVLPACT